MIVVEGPDGSGKSTLARVLSSRLKLPIADKVVASNTQPLTDLVAWTESNVAKGFQPTIFDRHRLISEPIYSPFKAHEPTAQFLDLGWVSDMTWNFYAAAPIIIYALPSIETVRRNVLDPATHNHFVAEWVNHVYAGYVAKAASDLTRSNCRLYNYHTTRIDDIVGWVSRLLEERLPNVDRPRIPRQSADSPSVGRIGPTKPTSH